MLAKIPQLLMNAFTSRNRVLFRIFIVLAVVIGSLVVFIHPTLAGTSFLTDIVVKVIMFFVGLLGHLFTWFVEILVMVAQFNQFITLPMVQTGWSLVRDVANMFFIVILLIIAFSTILKIQSYHYEKLLAKLLIMAVLINFSKLICGFLIDFFQVIMLTFVNGFKDAAAGNFADGFGIYKTLALVNETGEADWSVDGALVSAAIMALVMILVADMIILIMIAVLLYRIAMLWVLIIISPLAYLAYAGMPKYWTQWWQMFFQHLTSGPVIAFFLWLALLTMQRGNLGKEFVVEKAGGKDMDQGIGGKSIVGTEVRGEDLLQYMVMMALLMGGLAISQKMAQQSGSLVGGFAQKVQQYGTKAGMLMSGAAAVGWAAKQTKNAPGYLNELQASKTGISLNPNDWKTAWKEAREHKKNIRLATARGTARDIAERGFAGTAGDLVRGRKIRAGTKYREIAAKQKEIDEINTQLLHKDGLGKTEKNELEEKRDKAQDQIVMLEGNISLGRENYNKTEKGIVDNLQDHANWQGSGKLSDASYDDLADNKNWDIKTGHDTEFNNQLTQLNENNKNWGKNRTDVEKKIAVEEKTKKDTEHILTTSSDEQLAVRQRTKLQEKLNTSETELLAVQSGYMTLGEAEAGLNVSTGNLQENGKRMSTSKQKRDAAEYNERLAKTRGDGKAETDFKKEKDKQQAIYDSEKDSLQEESTKYKQYQQYIDDMKNKKDISQQAEAGAYGDIGVKTKLEGVSLDNFKKDLQGSIDDLEIKVNVEPLTTADQSALKADLDKLVNERDKLKKKAIKVAPPTSKYYRRSARKTLEQEEYKKVADIDSDSELWEFFLKAQKTKDHAKMSAVLKKMTSDGNDNEFLNYAGFSSDHKGMQQFVEKELIDKGGYNRGDAMALASDISYLNEKIGHWETARTVNVEHGEYKWMSEKDHVKAALAEIMKRNPREVARNFNRLAYGGERPNNEGGRDFEMGKLGLSVLKIIGPHIAAQIPKGEMNPNIIMNLYNANRTTGVLDKMLAQGELNSTLYRNLMSAIKQIEKNPSLDAIADKIFKL